MLKAICPAAVLLVFALAAAPRLQAQNWNDLKSLAIGTRVRISVASHTVQGQVQSVGDASLAIDSGKGVEMFTRQEVTRVSVKKESHRGRNALIGLGAGAAIGAVVGAVSHKDCTGFCIFYTSRGQDTGIGAVVVGVIGTGVGALIPTGGWREVYKQ